mmetsp:Transcript_5025/g.14238  ORF Transcript_5025/g.14238 Transcript_5025/m.14238 type:complete len:205 (+) Transcript_5025:1111-1725(+)
MAVSRSRTWRTSAPRERRFWAKTRCCALSSMRLRHSSTFMGSNVQGITESTSKPGSWTMTSSRRPVSLSRLHTSLSMAGMPGSAGSLAAKTSAIMQRTEPPPRRSIVGTGAATTLSTQDSNMPRCEKLRDSQPAADIASTVPDEPCSCKQLHAKFSICSSETGTTTFPAALRLLTSFCRSLSTGITSKQTTAKLTPTDKSTFVW